MVVVSNRYKVRGIDTNVVYTVFCLGFQMGSVPSEKGTLARGTDRQKDTLARGTDRQKGTLAWWTEEKGHN